MPISQISQSSANSRSSSPVTPIDGEEDPQETRSLEAEFTKLLEEIAGKAKRIGHRAQDLVIDVPPPAAVVQRAEPAKEDQDVQLHDDPGAETEDVAHSVPMTQDEEESSDPVEVEVAAPSDNPTGVSQAAAPVAQAEVRSSVTANAPDGEDPASETAPQQVVVADPSANLGEEAGDPTPVVPVESTSVAVEVAEAPVESKVMSATEPKAALKKTAPSAVDQQEIEGVNNQVGDQIIEVNTPVDQNVESPTDWSAEAAVAKTKNGSPPPAPIHQPSTTPLTPAVETLTATLLRHASEALGRVMGRDRGDAVGGVRSVTALQTPSSFNLAVDQKAAREAPRFNAPRPLTQQAGLRMMERVEQALKEAVKAKDGKSVSLKLDPPNLGQMRVDVSLRDGSLHARLTPESPAVVAFLQERAHDLQGMLRKLGLSVDEVTVSVRNEEFTSNESYSGGSSSGRKDPSFNDQTGRNFPSENGVSTLSQRPTQQPVDHWVA